MRERATRACLQLSCGLSAGGTHLMTTEAECVFANAQLIGSALHESPDELAPKRSELLEATQTIEHIAARIRRRSMGLAYLAGPWQLFREQLKLDEWLERWVTWYQDVAEPEVERRRLVVEFDVVPADYRWRGVPMFLRHIIVKLLQHAEVSPRSRLGIELAPNDTSNGYTIRLRDPGKGFDPAVLSDLFEPDEPRELTTRPPADACHEIVAAVLGGTIGYEPSANGSSVWLNLPKVSPGENDPQRAPPPTQDEPW